MTLVQKALFLIELPCPTITEVDCDDEFGERLGDIEMNIALLTFPD